MTSPTQPPAAAPAAGDAQALPSHDVAATATDPSPPPPVPPGARGFQIDPATLETTRPWSDIPFIRKPLSGPLLIILFWPAYLIVMWSGELYYRKKGKVFVRSRTFKVVLTLAVLVFFTFLSRDLLFGSSSVVDMAKLRLPECTSTDVKDMVRKRYAEATGRNIVDFKTVELGHDPGLDVRTCAYEATTTMTRGEGVFTVSWQEKAKGIYIVEF